MKTKSKLGLIFLCLLIFLTVAGVSASDVNEIDEFSANDAVSVDNADVAATPTVSDGDYNNELSSVDNSQSQLDLNENETNITDDKNGDVLSSKQDDDNLGASNAYEKVGNTITSTDTTFANLQKTINNAANGDIIVLTKDVSQGATSEIRISKNITINGNGHTLNANSKSYVFSIDYSYVKEFNLTNARIMNSYTQYGYGAISSTGGSETNKRTINIVNCTFSNCNSMTGSVFYFRYVDLTLVNSTISNNQVTGTSYNDGCISIRTGDATVINCNFTNNKGGGRTEGAVVGSYKSNFYFEDCLFKGSYSGYDGGALYLSSSNATIINCNFTGNNASYGSCWYSGRVLAKNCNFYENYQYNTSGCPSLIYGSSATLIDCNVYNNYLRSSYLVQLSSNSLVSNCNFFNNSGGSYIIYADGVINASVCNSNFTKNNYSSCIVYLGSSSGGVGNHTVIDCIFYNNTASRAISVSNTTIIGCNISGSNNTFSSGILSVSVNGANRTSSVINCTFSDFCSTYSYSSVMDISGSYLNSKVDIIDCNIYNNTVGMYGTIRITSNNVNVTFTNCNIYNNTAPYGGAFNITNGNVFINNCKIYNNRATNTSGGAICIMNSANLILNNSNLTHNIANFTGGAIYYGSTGSVTLTSCTIENNNASRGSAIFISANNVNSNKFTLENVRMLNNFANVTNILFNNYQNKRKFVFNTTFATWDNFLNGIYVAVDEAEYTDNIVVKNVTYYGEGGLVTTVDSEHSAIFGLETDPQYPTIHGGPNQNLTFKIYDGSDEIDSYQFATDLNGRVTFELSNLTADKNYTLKVIHYKDNYYGDYEKSTNFTVIKFIPTLVLNQSTVVYGDDIVVLIDDCWDAEGTMNLTYNSTSGPVTLSAPVINGTAVFSEDIPAAFYTLELWYSGDVNYPELNTTLDLEVTRIHPDFVIEAPEIGAGEEAVIFIYLPDGVTGTVFVNASDLYFATIDDVSSVRNVTLNGVPAFGRYTVNATYSGDERYYSASATCTLFVERLKSKLNISVNDVFVGEDVLINFSIVNPKNDSLLDTSSGKLRVFINGNMYNLDVVNGKSNLTISNLTMGNYSIIGLYDGDYYYSSTDSNSAFLVKGHDYAFNVSAENIREGSNATIIVNLPDDATGIITIKVNDSIYALDLSKGHNLTVSGLASGNYVVIASYAGDTNYYENTNSTNFTVFSRIVSELSFDKPVFVVDVASVINVSSNFPAGELFVYVDGVKQDAGVIVSGGKAKINLPGLSAGNHSVLVTFDGDYDYTNLTTSFDIFVEKYNSTVNVSASSVRTGNPVIVDVNASGNGTANIVIFNASGVLGSYNITVNNGKGSFIVPVDFVNGTYNLNITYLGDDIYYGSVNSTGFTVTDRIVSELGFDKPVFVVDVASVVNVSSNFPAGELFVYVDGVKQDAGVIVSGGKAKINLPGLSAGNHSVLVTFDGDYDYTNLTTSFDIFVEKYNSTVNVSASSVRTGNPVIVDVNASGNGSANIVIFNSTDIICEYDIVISNGKGYLQVPYAFPDGDYNLNITYNGDDIYYGSKNTTAFAVHDRINSTLNIDKFNFIVNTPDVITVSSNFQSGTVSVYIDGSEVDDITISDFEGTINLNPLTFGNHTILLMYSGNYNYTNLTALFNISVFKLNSTINVSATNVRTGNNIIIYMNASGDGIANIVIYNESEIIGEYNATISEGKGSFIVPYDFAEGSYLVNVTYLGDDTYYGSFNVTDFIVSDKIFSTLTLDKQDVIVNTPDVLVVSANFKSGTLNVYVDGVRHDDINIVNNKSEIHLDGLTVGEHNILLIYGGDYNYSSLTTSFSIRAHRYNSTVKVTGNDEFIYNNSIPLDITLNNTSTDADVPDAFVTVTVYYANGSVAYNNSEVGFTNEAVEHIVSDLMAGDYYVIVTYPGNENFTGNASERLDFTIHKASTSVTANVNDSTFNDVVTVEYVIHNDDNTGAVISNENVIIKIYNKAGNLVYETESASFKNMIGSFSITDHEFVAGNYTVNVTYSGNENFTGNYVVTTFEVSKARAAVSVNVNSTTFNQTVVVDYSLSNINNTNARIPDGNVNINIVNKANGMAVYADTSAFINEKGVLTITGFEFASGSYSATVSYDGDENFIGNSTTFDFTVSRARTAVSVNVNNITFNQNVIIEYELSNINGTNAHIPDSSVDIEITSKATGAIVYTGSSSFAGEKGVLEIADFEFASGNYIANVIYNGNENFTGNSSKFIFSVSRARTAVSANVNNTTFNQNVIVEYELSNDNSTSAHIPDGNVIVSIANKANGRTVYTCSSSFAGEKGLLKITDFEFGAGNYVVTVSYDGNANFTGNSTKFDFTVSRARTAVSVNVNNTTFNQNVVVEYAVVNVNGTAANIPDSKVSINITDKASGRIVYSNNKALFTNEKGVLEITNFEFASGDYSVSVGYAGNDNFTGNSTTFDFSVFKARTAISVNVSNITFNQKVIIDFNLSNDNATSAHIPNSKVTINIIDKDTNYNVYNRDVYFTDEKGTLEIIDFEFAAGNYTVNATYAGNDNFIGSSILSDFTVFKARTAVSVNVNNITFNQNVVVEYNLTNINGTSARIPNSNVNINIINKKTGVSVYNVNSSFNKEKGVLTITDFEFNAGNYSVTVTYAGNENFTGNSTEFDFTVLKARTSVSVKVNGTIFNQTVVIEYALSNADGTGAHIPDSDVTIKVTDKKTGRNVYTNVSSFVNEKGVLRINDFEFAGGNYTVTVAYAGNDNFIGNSTKSDFTVSKARTDLSAIIDNTVFNEDVVVKYNLSNADATGAHIPDSQVTINIVNAETGQSVYSKMSSFTNEEGILNITEFDFAAGNYIANITYAGNANFTDNSISVPFTVSKAHTNVSVNVNNITFNQNAVVEYNLENIDGTSANIPDGNVVINVTAANNRKVIYSADASFVNGKGVFNSSNYEFAAGNYTVTVIYNGNENFTGNSTKFNFTVSKANTGILVNVNSTVYNQTVVIEYNLSNINGTSAHIPDGRVTVTVVNKLTGAVVYSSTTASFTDEYGTLPIFSSKVPAGEYTVNVSYAGNANFTDSSASFDFMVYKARTQVYADVNDTTFNQNVVVAYNLENIEGTDANIPNSNVIISVRNIQGDLVYNTTDLFVREKGMLNISDYEFNAGEYTVEVTYNGNDNFEGSSFVYPFRVFKALTEVSAKVNNVTYDQNIVVEYSLNNANGTSAHIPDGHVDVSIIEKSTGTIIYNEISYFVNEEGTLTTANSHFASGDYTVSVEYMGSENFFGNNSLFDFTVYKAHSSVSVNVNNTVFNNAVAVEYALDNVDTNASVPMGNVTVKIINKENSEVIYTGISSFADEKGILYINDFEFAVGEYTANVTYEGSTNFIGGSAASDFIVSKAHTLIVSHASSVIFNNDVIFSVNVINTDTRAVLNKSLEMVTVDIDGDNGYSYHCISSIYDANKAFSNLGAGKYNATVKYNGGSNFLASNDVRFSFTVSRANTSSAVSADNVTYNNTVTVYGEVYNLNTSASVSDYDLVNVSVYNDGEIVYSANVTVGSLRSGYVLPLLDAGEYGVTAYYYNSENFTESIADAEFSISKANSLIQFIDDYVVMGNNLSFSVVNISDGSTITLKVNNRTYTGSVVDGVGYVLIDSGDSGIFNNVLVTFDGDTNYNPSNSTGTVKFIRPDSFTALQLLIDENTGGNLIFNNDFVFDSNTDDVNGVKVNKSINIDGNGYVLDASGASSMFDVTADNVNIANTAICNVDVSDNGNVIAWSGDDGSINNVAFENNNIDNGNVISIDADNVTINNSRFTNNSGINCDVISIEDAENTVISNSVFEDNTIANGAVIDIAGCVKTSISNSDFTNNNVAGGAIIEIAESGDTSIDNTSFAGNDLTSNSIAVDVADSNNTNIEGLNFTDNTVSRNSTLLNIDNAKSVNLTDVKFNNDNASGDSSIAAIDDSSDVKVNGLNIDSCKVDGSNSIMTIDDSEVNISNSLMTNNAADKGNVVTIDLDSEVYLDNVATLNNSNNNQHCDITYETYVEINSSDIHVGENAMVDVNVITSYPYDVKGILVITANGDKYYFTLTDDEGSFPISGLKEGRYNISAVYMGNKYIDNTFSNAVMINVFKVDDFNFTADNTVITTSESLVMNLPSDASGNVTVVVGNDKLVVPVVNGKAIVNGDKLPLGVNNLKASYSGDDKYVSKDLSDVISVKCDNYDITVENNDLTYGDNLIIELPEGTTGQINVTVGNKSFNVPINKGKAVISADDLPLGYSNVTVSYDGNDKYVPGNMSETIRVRLGNYTMDVDSDIVVSGDDLVVNLPADASGNVSVVIGNETFVVPVVDGKANISTDNLSIDDYNISISYSGDDKYVPKDITSNISIVSDIVVTAPDVNKYYGGPERFVVNVADIKGKGIPDKNVTVIINNITYSRITNEYGNISLPVNLPSGEYIALIKVDDKLYNASVTVNPTIIGHDFIKVYMNDSQFYVTVYGTDGNYLPEGSLVVFNINGVFYKRTADSEGRVKLNINLPQGTYIITSNNTVTGEVCSNNVTVISKIINNYDVVKYYCNGTHYYVTLLDDLGNPVGAGVSVTFNINGVFYTRSTNASGVAKLNINLPEGDYVITADYDGCVVSNNVKVLPVLTAEDLVKTYGTRDKFVVNVFDGQGNPYPGQAVSFNINGVFYTRTSDVNGQAMLNINLPVGEYIITSSYNGTSISNKVTVVE